MRKGEERYGRKGGKKGEKEGDREVALISSYRGTIPFIRVPFSALAGVAQ